MTSIHFSAAGSAGASNGAVRKIKNKANFKLHLLHLRLRGLHRDIVNTGWGGGA